MKTSYQYRNSCIPVLDQIPSHWKELRSKYFLHERDDRSSDGNEDLLSVSQYNGVTKKRKQNTGSNDSRASSLAGYKKVDQDNLVINIMLAWNGSLGVSKYQGIVSPAYGVYQIKNAVLPSYLHYLVKSDEYKKLFKMYSTGVIDSRLRLYSDQLFSLRFIVPPYREQELIAHYLDYMNHLINKYIRIKKRQIELLKEMKQIIITNAITGKIDVHTGKPYPKYKDSGVDWLGEIPEEWNIYTLKQCTRSVNTGGTPKDVSESHYDENGLLWYTPGDFTDDLLLGTSSRKLSRIAATEIPVFPEATVMMIGIGATIGKTSLSKLRASCNQQVNAIIVKSNIQPEYLTLLLRCCREYIISTGNYTTLPIINQESTKKLQITFPPKQIQNQVVMYIEKQTAVIDTHVNILGRSIDLIKEYQTRLISDVVTGKLSLLEIVVPNVSKDFLDMEIDTTNLYNESEEVNEISIT